MFEKAYSSDLPSYESLPKIKPSELGFDLIKIWRETRGRSKGAVPKMAAYVCVTTGKPAGEVSIEDIKNPNVAGAMIEYSKIYPSLLYQSRVVYRALGAPKLLPIPYQVYSDYHPLLLEWLESSGIRPRRAKGVRAACMGFLKWACRTTLSSYEPHTFPLTYIQRRHLIEYRHHLMLTVKKGNRNSVTARWYLQLVVRWFKWLVKERHIGSINFNGLTISPSTSRERRIPGHLQVSKFIVAFMNTPVDEVYILFFLLLLATGARPIEIRTLKMEDIDFSNHSIRLQSKNGPERWVPIGINLWTALTCHLNKQKSCQSTYVLLGRTGKPLDEAVIQEHYSNVKLQSGIDLDGPMAIRHRFATECYQTKVPVSVFQYLMGHRTTSEMKRYQHRNEYLESQEVERAVLEWLGDLS